MRWASATGTVLLTFGAAIISPIVVQKWQDRERETAQVLSVQDLSIVPITRSLADVSSSITSSGEVKILHRLFIDNGGSDDLYDVTIDLVGHDGDPITHFGDVSALGEAQDPEVKLNDGRVTITFRTLKVGETVALWVVSKSVEPIAVRSAVKDLNIEQNKLDSSDYSFDYWLSAGFAFLGLAIGIMVSEWGNRHVLRTIGFEPKEVARIYKEAIKKSENKDSD